MQLTFCHFQNNITNFFQILFVMSCDNHERTSFFFFFLRCKSATPSLSRAFVGSSSRMIFCFFKHSLSNVQPLFHTKRKLFFTVDFNPTRSSAVLMSSSVAVFLILPRIFRLSKALYWGNRFIFSITMPMLGGNDDISCKTFPSITTEPLSGTSSLQLLSKA